MTVIWSNKLDVDCILLQKMCDRLDNVNVVEIVPDSEDWEDLVNTAIANEHETILFAGHGTEHGLLFPDFSSGEYILHENNVDLINAKNVLCVWCHASSFCYDHDLNAFATGMFISNIGELYDNITPIPSDVDQEFINKVNIQIFNEINSLLMINAPTYLYRMSLGVHMDCENVVDMFNRSNLYFNSTSIANELFCSRVVCEALRLKGINIECAHKYNSKGELVDEDDYTSFECWAPTHDEAVEWLRRKKNIYIIVTPYHDDANDGFYVNIYIKRQKQWDIHTNVFCDELQKLYSAPHKAIDAGIKYVVLELL